MLVLDTHVALWWSFDPKRLSARAAREIADAEQLLIPAIAYWETAVLVRKRRLALELSVAEWARELESLPRVATAPMDASVALLADTLAMHEDPADRFIVATAIVMRARLLTKDRQLRGLPFVKCVW